MSKVKIKGNSSGNGVLTIEAPNTDTDRTITLPDGTGTLATTAIAQLDHSGTKKLETTADGVTISGGSSTAANLTVTSTATDDNIAPDLILYRNSASPADSDNLGGLEWQGNHSGGSVNSYAQITCLAEDVTDGTEDGALRFYTATNGSTTEKLRIDSSGNVGIGTSSPGAKLEVSGNLQLDEGSTGNSPPLVFGSETGNPKKAIFLESYWMVYQGHDNEGHIFRSVDGSGNTTDDMVIKGDGKVNIGGTDTVGHLNVERKTAGAVLGVWNSHSDGVLVKFFSPAGGARGSISLSGSTTIYATSSDYRLKENVVPMTGSIDRLKELKPSKFNFIADADTTVDGFLAHEAQEVVPEAITGEKDGMQTEEYEVEPAVMDGETEVTPAVMGEREVEDYQGIDQSKLVPLLTSALQEAVAKIEDLEKRIEILEAK